MSKHHIEVESVPGTPTDGVGKYLATYPLEYKAINIHHLPTYKIEITLSQPLTEEEQAELGRFMLKVQQRILSP
jgi:hypothetical protein